jgi:hypothetical protein
MGTWDYGLLDNDSAGDELWEILHESVADARKAATQDLTPERAGRLAAQLALIVHYHAISEVTELAEMRAGVTRNRAALEKSAPKAAAILDQIVREAVGDDPQLRPLFEAKHAATYLQSLADASLEEVETCLEEQRAGAHLDLLTVLAPYVELRAKTVKHIARRVRELADDVDEDEEDRLHAYTKACKKLLTSCADDDEDDD